MNMKTSYTYTVLRYVHDITSGEFINVGVAIHAPEARFTKMLCRHTYGRLSRFFPGIKHDHFKALMKHIESKFNSVGEKLYTELPWKSFGSVSDLVKTVLPEDDSSLQWSAVGVGRTDDPAVTVEKLFERMVLRYEEKPTHERKSEEDVWRHFKRTLETRHLLKYFEPRKISVQDDELDFDYTWKNGVLHCLEPISFDLSSPDSIRDKAHKWLGRISSVANSPEKFRIYFLVGQPQDQALLKAYDNALKILSKAPVENHIIPEEDVETLSNIISREVERHEARMN